MAQKLEKVKSWCALIKHVSAACRRDVPEVAWKVSRAVKVIHGFGTRRREMRGIDLCRTIASDPPNVRPQRVATVGVRWGNSGYDSYGRFMSHGAVGVAGGASWTRSHKSVRQ